LIGTPHIEFLERRKRRTLFVLLMNALGLLVLLALRFVPWLNDALSGKPEYVRALTQTAARQLATETEMQSPVMVERDEGAHCQAVNGLSIPDDEVRGTIYLMTYSERQHLTCITTYIVPMDASRFSNLRNFTPVEGKNYGPALLQQVSGIAADRMAHVYAVEYLKRLHWRYTPHFPLSPSEAASLTSHSYYSGAGKTAGSANIQLDYGELRAQVAKRHETINFCLSILLIIFSALCLLVLRKLALIYREASQYSHVYHSALSVRAFLTENIATQISSARRRYFEKQQQAQAKLREEEKLRSLRVGWVEGLRSALPNLSDEELRTRIGQCLERDPQDWEEMRSLWVEVQERTGQKTPAEKLDLLLESARPYCTEEEFLAARTEALALLARAGFRAARQFAVAMHDQFKLRAREMEELERSGQGAI
jgi:hypothetical protein